MRGKRLLSGLMLAALAAGGASFPQAPAAPAGDKKAETVLPFNGKDLTGWKFRGSEKKSQWVVGGCKMDPKNPKQLLVTPPKPTGKGGPDVWLLINAKGGVDLYTEEKFGDALIEVEFMIPKGSNSGVYVMGEYEIQILDSFGKEKINAGDLGGIYQVSTPKVNASKAPGEWQKFVIEIKAPRFENGKKVSNAKFLKVTLNDQVIHENVEMTKGVTPTGVTGKEAATGPLMFQGDHGPVAFRRIAITPMNYK